MTVTDGDSKGNHFYKDKEHSSRERCLGGSDLIWAHWRAGVHLPVGYIATPDCGGEASLGVAITISSRVAHIQ